MRMSSDQLIQERINPKIYDPRYMITKKIKTMLECLDLHPNSTIFDAGCGLKPYSFLFDNNNYIGMDISQKKADIIGSNLVIPVKDQKIDLLIATSVLEHIFELDIVVKEFSRILKREGMLFCSVPFLWKEHGEPFDYWRFTKFSLYKIFEKFEIKKIEPSNGYISSLLLAFNNLIMIVPIPLLFKRLLFLITNAVGLTSDYLVIVLDRLNKRTLKSKNLKRFVEIYFSMPTLYIVIIKKN